MGWRKRILVLLVMASAVGCVNMKVGEVKAAGSESGGKSGGWKEAAVRVLGQVFMGAKDGIVFYAFDVLCEPNEPVELVARLQEAELLDDIEDMTVGFYLDTELVGEAVTDDEGFARLKWMPAGQGDYELSVKVKTEGVKEEYAEEMAGLESVPLLVSVRPRETRFVVVDLDHTVVESSFLYVLLGQAKPMEGSVEMMKKIAEQYSVIYLTHRPDLLTHLSKNWLRKHGYPRGVLLVSTIKQVLGGSGDFKTGRLMDVRVKYPNISLGIGDKLSDAEAYVANGMTAYLIPYYKKKSKDMRRMARDIRLLGDQEGLQVVRNWQEIEQGLFQGKKYPAKEFAKWLDKQADWQEELED